MKKEKKKKNGSLVEIEDLTGGGCRSSRVFESRKLPLRIGSRRLRTLISENRDVGCEGVRCLVLYVAEKADGWLVKLWE